MAAQAARDEGQTMSEEEWRVVCLDATHAVEVVLYGSVWAASIGDEQYEGGDPRDAVMALVGRVGVRDGWPVVELLAPGEPSREELRAAVRGYLTAQDALDANAANIGAFEDRIVARKALDVLVGGAT